MAGYLTDYSNNKVLDTIFGGATWSGPGILYVGLSTLGASKSGTVSEPSSGGYARIALQNTAAAFPNASAGTKTNAVPLVFPTPTADWGSIASVFVADAPTGGNVLAIAELPTAKVILNGSPAPQIAAGALYLSHT